MLKKSITINEKNVDYILNEVKRGKSPSFSWTVNLAINFFIENQSTMLNKKSNPKKVSSFDIDEIFAEIKKRNPSEERNGRHKRWHIEKAIEAFGAAKILKEIAKCQDAEKIRADNLITLCTWIPKEERKKKDNKPKVNTTDEWIPDEQYGGLKINRNYIPK